METCPTCGTPYGKRRRCYKCNPGYRRPSYGRKRTGEWHPCPVCQTPVYAAACHLKGTRGAKQYCSQACRAQAMRGKPVRENPIGHRRVRLDGYVEIKVKSGRGAYQLEHRVIAAEMLGRPLKPHEQVHHLDADRRHNEPSNLEVIDAGSHARLSNQQGAAARKALRRENTELRAQLEHYERVYGKLLPLFESQEAQSLCEHCGASYVPSKPAHVRASRYCSKACQYAAMHAKAKAYHAERRPDPVTCQHCGKVYQLPTNRLAQAKYCSKACKDAALQKDNPEKACARCGQMFRKRTTKETATAEYCSRRCALAVVTEHRLKDYVPPEPKMCAYCAQSYCPRSQSEAEGKRYCSRACWRRAHARPPVTLRLISGGG